MCSSTILDTFNCKVWNELMQGVGSTNHRGQRWMVESDALSTAINFTVSSQPVPWPTRTQVD